MAWRKQGSLTALSIFLFLMFFSLLDTRANAQEKARVTSTIDDAVLARIDGSVSPRLAQAADLGRLEADAPLQRILLRLEPSDRQKAALKRLVEDQHNPNSAMYRKWLTPEQFATQFGPAEDDLKAVGGWLQSKGFTVTRTGRGGQYMEFSGSSGQVETAFHTEMHRYQVNGEKHIANSTQISIPAALAPVVKGVVSLNDFHLSSQISKMTQFKRNQAGKLVAQPQSASSARRPSGPQYYNQDFGGNFVTPGDLATIYDSVPAVKSGIDGTGVSIAVVGRSNVALSDISTFRTLFGLPDNLPQIILDGPDPGIYETGSNYDDEAEADLDVEYAGSIAPMATVKFVPVASTQVTDGITLSALYIVNNAIAPIVSASFGTCEGLLGADGNSFFNALWQQAAAEGMTALVSAGDYGSAGCDQPFYDFPAQLGLGVNGIASTPYNVAVGGTAFLEGTSNATYWSTTNAAGTLASVQGYIPEIAWNDSCDSNLPSTLSNCNYSPYSYTLEAGGGGASNCLSSTVDSTTYPSTITCTSGGYAKPSWQTGPGVPADGARDIPDVALDASFAHDPIVICFDSSCQYTANSDGSFTLNDFTGVGGTSASTPMMASIMAMVEQQNGQFLGQVNPILYQLAAKQDAASCNASTLTAPGTATACIFHDVTASTIAVPCVGGSAKCSSSNANVDGLLTGFGAGSGYDEATGLGSPDVTNLVKSWPAASGVATSTTLSTSTSTFVHGTPVTATVKVAPSFGTGTPSGDIVLEAQSNGVLVPQGASDAATLVSGTMKESVTDLTGGTYNLVARYAGDATFAASTSNAVALTVMPEPSTVSLTVTNPFAANPLAAVSSIPFGQPYYIQAVVAGKSGQGIPTGSITFYDGTTALGTFVVDQSGTALLPIGPIFQNNPYNIYLNPGSHSLSAKYSGDASFNAATGTGTLTVAQSSPLGQIMVQPNASVQTNQTVLLQAILVGGSLTLVPTGSVTITDNGSPIATVPLVADTGVQVALANGPAGLEFGGSQGVVSFAFKTAGTHVISLTYAGDTNFLAATPASVTTVTLTVTKPALLVPTVQLYDFASTVPVGTGVRYTAQVSGNGPTPTGTITLTPQFNWFSNENNPITPATLKYGVATLNYAWSEAEPLVHIVAVYSGDANYAPATSNVVTNTITQATPKVAISAAAPYVLPGSQTTVRVSLTSPIGTSSPIVTGLQSLVGKIQLYDTVNGATTALGLPVQTLAGQFGASDNDTSIAIVPITLAAGAHSLTAQFLGNPNYVATASSNSASIIVANPDFAVTGSSSTVSITAGATGTETITVSPILGYSGTVAFACSGLPAGASCSFAPNTVSGSGSTVVSIPTVAPSSSGTAELGPGTAPWWTSTLAGGSALACVLLIGIPGRRRRTIIGAMTLAFIISLGLNGCGGEGVASTTLTLGTSAVKAAAGTTVTLTATLSSSHAAPYSGSVTFYDQTANAPIGVPEGFIGNQARMVADNLAVGTHQIIAKYSGDTHTTASQSSVLSQTITGTSNATITATSGSLSHSLQVAVTID